MKRIILIAIAASLAGCEAYNQPYDPNRAAAAAYLLGAMAQRPVYQNPMPQMPVYQMPTYRSVQTTCRSIGSFISCSSY